MLAFDFANVKRPLSFSSGMIVTSKPHFQREAPNALVLLMLQKIAQRQTSAPKTCPQCMLRVNLSLRDAPHIILNHST